MSFNPLQYPLALSDPRWITGESAWTGHIPFAWALLEMLRPRTVVELGTHAGDSYCAFCQGVVDLKLDAKCFAVDTWRGDAHTGPYAEGVFQNLRKYHDPAFGTFSTLLRMTFDEAVSKFDDGSIDLLHIDGLHTYEGVRHDFETWKPKVSDRGVILFHDVAVAQEDFGVFKLWKELDKQYPSFAFPHDFGLGVLVVGQNAPAAVLEFIEQARKQRDLVRRYFATLGARMDMTNLLVRWASPLEEARALVAQWRTRNSKPPPPPPLANDDPRANFGRGVLADVKELFGQLVQAAIGGILSGMPSIDMPLDKLREYQPPLNREADFEDFWRSTLAELQKQPINAELIPYNLPARGLQCYAVRFDGFQGGRIAGWYLRPDSRGKFPGVCYYHGYSGRGARPFDLVALASQGICVLSMDCRGQNGQSQDTAVYPEGYAAGWMTQGIRDPKQYYYRYVYADAVRALELLARREEVDNKRLAIAGISQGGGLTLAVAALSERPILALPDIPYLCDFRRGVQISPAGPYTEIPVLLKSFPDLHEQAFRTLSYIDAMNLAPMIKCRTVLSNCLWDDICPPSTIFGVYNHLTCQKQIEVYPYHKHEVPYEHHELKFRLLVETLLESTPAKAGA